MEGQALLYALDFWSTFIKGRDGRKLGIGLTFVHHSKKFPTMAAYTHVPFFVRVYL